MVQDLGSNDEGGLHLDLGRKAQLLFNLRLLGAELEDFSMKDGFEQLVIDAVTTAAITRDDAAVDAYAAAGLDQLIGAQDLGDGRLF